MMRDRYQWQLVDFRLTARRDAKAAKAFLNKANEHVRMLSPVPICTNKAPTYGKVIRKINHRYDPYSDYITHVDRKYLNNRVESNHAALKRFFGYRESFRSLRSAKTTLLGMQAIRTVKNDTYKHSSRRPRRDQLRPRAI
jgi:transposase, IS6 family